MKYILIITAVLLLFSCNNKKSVTKANETPTPSAEINPVENKEEPTVFKVSFYSPGNGIDYNIKKEYDDFLLKKYSSLTKQEKKWGREGEVDYCIDTKILTKEEKKDFLNQSKVILSQSIKVRFNESSICE